MLFKKYQQLNFNPFKRISLFAVLGLILIITGFWGLSFEKANAATITDKYGNTITGESIPYSGTVYGKNIFLSNDGKSYYEGTGNTGYTAMTDSEKIATTLKNIEQRSVAHSSQQTSSNSCPYLDVFCHLRTFTLWISNGILWLFSWLVWLAAQILDIAVNLPQLMGGFTKSPVVAIGWPIVRDLANMFFSLILLVIAFATILRIETYGMKQVLWKLIVAALLINFSLVIAGVVIDGSNVLTNFFIRGNFTLKTGEKADISAAIYNGLKLQNLYNTDVKNVADSGPQLSGGAGETNSQLKILLNTILGIIFMMVTAFVLFAAGILFIIRLIALWILLIFAPLAWLAMILPATRNLWNKWWHEFMKWIIFAPVYAFFIYLTVAVINKNILHETLKQGQQTYAADGLTITTFLGSNLSFVANYLVLIVFMVAGLIFARQSGISGATAMAKLGTNLRNAGGRMASRWAAKGGKMPGAAWAANKLGLTGTLDTWQKGEGWKAGLANAVRRTGRVKETLFAAASPQVWSRYWAYRKQRADAAAFDGGAGRLDAFSTGFTGAIRNFSSASKSKQEEVTKQEAQKIFDARMRGDTTYENRDISGATVDQMMQTRGITPGTPQAEAFMRQHDWETAQDIAKDKIVGKGAVAGLGATFDQMFGKGRLEQIAESREVGRRQQEFSQTLKDEDQIVDYYTKAKDPVDREALFRLIASINGLNTLFARLRTDFNPRNLSQYIQKNFRGGRAEVLGADISAMASQSGNFSFVGTTAWDASKGKIRFATPEEQEATAVRKALEMEPQAWARQIHPDAWLNRDATGAQTGISEFAKGMLDQMTAAHINQIDRFQGRTLTALYKFRNDLLAHVNTIQNPIQHNIANSFVSKLIERYEKPK